MKHLLKGLLVFGLALAFAMSFFAQEASAYTYRPYWNHYGATYGPIHYSGHHSYSYSYGWSGWDYHRVRYNYHYPYRYQSWGNYRQNAYFHPGWTRYNYVSPYSHGYGYSYYPWSGRYW